MSMPRRILFALPAACAAIFADEFGQDSHMETSTTVCAFFFFLAAWLFAAITANPQY
jgi:hypothetical protein